MPQLIDQEYKKTETVLLSLMNGINPKGNADNCGHIVLRLDEHFRAGKNLGLGPVPKTSAEIYTYPTLKEDSNGKLYICRSTTQDARLIARCKTNSPIKASLDLTMNDDEPIEVDLSATISQAPESKDPVELALIKSNPFTIIEDLRSLRRCKNNTAFGFLIFTEVNTSQKGHLINFYVNEHNQVFFLDAQEKSKKNWIRSEPYMDGYESEIFFLQSVPDDGFLQKHERSLSLRTNSLSTSSMSAPLQFSFPEEKGAYSTHRLNAMSKCERISLIELAKCHRTDTLSPSEYHSIAELRWAASWFLGNSPIKDNIKLSLNWLEWNIENTQHSKSRLLYYAINRKASKSVTVLSGILPSDSYYDMGQAELGMIYYKSTNFKSAFESFEHAVNANPHYEYGQIGLAACYYLGQGVTQNSEKALDGFLAYIAARRHSSQHSRTISSMYHTNVNMLHTLLITCLTDFEKTSHRRKDDIHDALGYCYINGLGVKKNLDQACHHYQKALSINPNHAFSHFYLGILKHNTDHTLSADHIRKAHQLDPSNSLILIQMGAIANDSSLEGQVEKFNYHWRAFQMQPYHDYNLHQLHDCFKNGLGTAVNARAAFQCLKMATSLKTTKTEYLVQLSNYYRTGYGTEVNLEEAYQYAESAIYFEAPGLGTNRSVESLMNLYWHHYHGKGTPRDTLKAFTCFITAIFIFYQLTNPLEYCSLENGNKYACPKSDPASLKSLFDLLVSLNLNPEQRNIVNDFRKHFAPVNTVSQLSPTALTYTAQSLPFLSSASSSPQHASSSSNSVTCTSHDIIKKLQERLAKSESLLESKEVMISMQRKQIASLDKGNVTMITKIEKLKHSLKNKAPDIADALEVIVRENDDSYQTEGNKRVRL